MLHPGWVINYFRNGGLPMLGNWQPYAPANATPDDVADMFAKQTPDSSQTREDLPYRIGQQHAVGEVDDAIEGVPAQRKRIFEPKTERHLGIGIVCAHGVERHEESNQAIGHV